MDTDHLTPPGIAPNAVVGWELRWLLTLMLLDHGGVLTIPQMVRRLEAEGLSVPDRASKVVSDALRLEIGKGRVRRVARGRYTFAGMPKATKSRFRTQARRVRELRAFATVRTLAVMHWEVDRQQVSGR